MICARFTDLDVAAFVVDSADEGYAEFRQHLPSCSACGLEVIAFESIGQILSAEGNGLVMSEESEFEASGHPSEDELLAFAELEAPALTRKRRFEVELHVQTCFECRSAVGVARSFDFTALQAPSDSIVSLEDANASRDGAGESPSAADELAERRARRSFSRRDAFALAAGISLVLLGWQLMDKAPPTSTDSSASNAGGQSIVQEELKVESDRMIDPTVEEPVPEKLAAIEGRRLDAVEAGPKPGNASGVTPSSDDSSVAAVETEVDSKPSIDLKLEDTPVLYAFLDLPDPSYRSPSPLDSFVSTPLLKAGTENVPTLVVLAPEHLARTTHASPTLYWYIDGETDLKATLVIEDDRSLDPILKLDLGTSLTPGLHALDLRAHEIELKVGVEYEWMVSLADPGNDKLVAKRSLGRIERIEVPPSLRAGLEGAGGIGEGNVYAAGGIWYDALRFYSEWAEKRPQDPAILRLRSSLLEQAGLDGVTSDAPSKPATLH